MCQGFGTPTRRAVYTGMKRVTLTVVAILLAAPAAAWAKAGIEFNNYPEQAKVGEKQTFTIMVLREPRDPNGGRPTPIVGKHPLVTFRSDTSGRVIRVRGGRTDPNGMTTGTVAFPDKGPWTSEIHMRGVATGAEYSQKFSVGTGLTVNVPPTTVSTPKPEPAGSSGGGGFPWVWVLSIAAILSALLVAAARVGLMPRRVRGLFGGSA